LNGRSVEPRIEASLARRGPENGASSAERHAGTKGSEPDPEGVIPYAAERFPGIKPGRTRMKRGPEEVTSHYE